MIYKLIKHNKHNIGEKMGNIAGILILVGIGLLAGYLLFGRRNKVVYVQNTSPGVPSGRTVGGGRSSYGYSRGSSGGGSGSNLLGTAAAVAGGVVAGELIADAVEDMVDGDVIDGIQEGVGDAVDYVGDAIDDAGGFVEDVVDDFGGDDFGGDFDF